MALQIARRVAAGFAGEGVRVTRAAETGSALAPHRASRTATPALLASQRADGSWPRIPDEPYSSPTATGLALTALTAGGLGPQDTAVAHGLRLSALVSSLYQDPALLAFLTTVLGSEVSTVRDPVERHVLNILHGEGDTHGAHTDDHPLALVLFSNPHPTPTTAACWNSAPDTLASTTWTAQPPGAHTTVRARATRVTLRPTARGRAPSVPSER